MSAPEVIADTPALETLCTALRAAPILAVDTEFIREKTYFPQACLIQVATAEGAWAIDPLAPGIDLSPFFGLMDNPVIAWVFHAGRQDLEILQLYARRLPAVIFDTQIAAQFLGFGESVAYSDLVKQLLNVSLDKGMRFTDWQKRPLSPRQIEYALADVIYLRQIHERMMEQLNAVGRLSAAQEEMQALLESAAATVEPEEAWRRIRHGTLKPAQLAALRAVAGWREREALSRNVPRGHIIKDDALLQIVAACPKNEEELSHLRGMHSLSRGTRKAVVETVAAALASPPDTWPTPPRRAQTPPHVADTVQLLVSLLTLICSREHILPRLVATREDLEAMVMGKRDVKLLHDWRYALFGRHAEAFLTGHLNLRYDPESKQIVF
ncbi:MAG: ribonuclease D [Alphaproteobacteria bacterium]|nr:ribonuclease D [Alphaproteobacteria bacterium]